MTDTIKALIDAGEKATQGEWEFRKDEFNWPGEIGHGSIVCDDWFLAKIEDIDSDEVSDFIVKAANARPAITAMYEENRELKEALQEFVDRFGPTESEMIFSKRQTIKRARAVLAKYGRE